MKFLNYSYPYQHYLLTWEYQKRYAWIILAMCYGNNKFNIKNWCARYLCFYFEENR